MSDAGRAREAGGGKSSDVVTLDDARTYAAIALSGGWIGYFLFTGMPQLAKIDVYSRTLTMHLLLAAVALVYVAYLAIARRLPGGSPLDLPVLGFIGAYVLATLFSINWRASLESTLLIGAVIVVFYALSDLPWLSARSLRRVALITGGALSAYAVWVVGNDYANYLEYVRAVEGIDSGNIFPPTVPRVHDVGDHPNVLAMLLTLLMPFFALTAYRGGDRWERAGGALALLLGALAIFLTLSRGGWIGVFAGVGFTLIGGLLTVRAYDGEEAGFAPAWDNIVPRDVSPTAIATIGGALALAVGGTLAFLSSSSTRPGWLFRSSLSPREDAWESGLEMFGDNPIFGVGPNSFGLLYPQYSGRFLVHTQHAHNGFLQVADDLGIIGLLALAAIAAATVYMLLSTWRRGSLEQRLLAVTCGGALIGFSLHNQLDAGNIWKSIAIALALVGAIVVRNYRELPARETSAASPALVARVPEAWRDRGLLASRIALLALLVVPFAAWVRIDMAHRDYWRGIDAVNQGDFEGIAALQDAVNADSSMMVYQMQLGQAQATAYKNTPEAERDQALIEAAVVHLEQAIKLDKRSDLAHANLARAYQLAGRNEDAAREANITRLAGTHVAPVLAVAEVYEDLGYEEDAISTYGQVLSMDAGLADSTFWDTPWRTEHFDEIAGESILARNPCTLGGTIVQAHRTNPAASLDGLVDAETGCRGLVFQFPNDLVIRVALAKIFLENGNPDDAFVHLDYAVNRQPDFGPARTELGRWYAAQGDTEKARHEWIVAGQLEEAEAILELGESYPQGEVPPELRERLRTLLAGSGSSINNDVVSRLYYRFRYGRISPVYALIPATWQGAVPRVYELMQAKLREWDFEARPGGPPVLPGRPTATPVATATASN